jgi:biotin synthase-related radical SAM superfamily protein
VDKAVADVVEVAQAARDESGVKFVHLNAGFQGNRGVQFAEPYVAALKERVGVLVGAQLAPQKDFSHYDRLIALGVDHLSFCLEFVDPEWFAKICTGKERVLGQQIFFDSIEYCAKRMGKGAVSGEIIAGVEPVESTIKGIDWIADHGAFPTVCIFRPTVGSDMESWPSPKYEDMRPIMEHVYQACRRNWIPIGAAPNIEVSIVVNPDDTALLVPRTPAFYVYEAYRRTVRALAQPLFSRRMRPHPRRDPGANGEIPPPQSAPTAGGGGANA